MHTIPLIKLKNIKKKKKNTSHTTACLTLFTRAFCHTRFENLLKGPDTIEQKICKACIGDAMALRIITK